MDKAFALAAMILAPLWGADQAVPPVDRAFSVDGSFVRVAAGDYTVARGVVHIAENAMLDIRPADVGIVEDETIQLPDVEPSGYWNGAMLAGPRTVGINAPGSFIEESLVVTDAETGRVLEKRKDYRVSAPFALLGLGVDPSLPADALVRVRYRYYMQRIDAILCDGDGRLRLVEGAPSVAEPLAPEVGAAEIRLANVYRPYGAGEVKPEHLYPVLASGRDAITATTRGRIPKTLHKLDQGLAVTIVCLGDSITAGGDASSPDRAYVAQFAAGLRRRFPLADTRVVNVSMGGTRSAQWLYDGQYPGTKARPSDQCTFGRVVAERPDLVTVEFLNDMTLPPRDLPKLYGEILARVRDAGAELLLIAPGFCHPSLMGTATLEDAESLPYVPLIRFLQVFAEKHRVAYADVAGRWEHLRREGLPFMTLLRNQYNHPGDRGHALYAEELLKCFEQTPGDE